ncbi:MAG: N,N-dimethylformamidase beta subunit family domain-containing protein [Dehalococcoidia bacterium]
MAFRFLTGDTDGVIYAGGAQGDLVFYKDEARNGTPRWANSGSGAVIGNGWDAFTHVFTAGNGIIYAVAHNGDLLYFRDVARDGTSRWSNSSGQRIGSGWQDFKHIINGDDGVIYAVAANGDLYFFRDSVQDGSSSWDAASGTIIGSGWDAFTRILPGGQGVIYAIDSSGDLFWFKDQGRDGQVTWANGGAGVKIGTDWGNFIDVISAGDGVFYAITPDGFMVFLQDLGRDGTVNWAFNGAAVTLGGGWTAVPAKTPTVQGYCSPLSVAPGETVRFHVSALAPYDVSFLRLKQQAEGEVGAVVATGARQGGGFKPSPSEAWAEGCGWSPSFSWTVPAGTRTGVYSARCTDFSGESTHLCFVVRPGAAPRGEIALLANTNTWNAYNDYGGRSKYTKPVGATLSFARPNAQISPLELSVIDHLLRAELWLHNWLEDEGYKVDMFADADLHNGISNFSDYKAVILSTHPEYWSAPMLDELEAYIAAGGSVLYLGGNGIFECVELDLANDRMICMGGDNSRNRDDFYFRNLNPPRSERAVLGVAYRYDNFLTFGPFQVLAAGHRLFQGTGLRNGDPIGATGINGGGASGWEMDTSIAGLRPPGVIVSANGADDRGTPPANLVVLARGTNPGFGADMTVYDTPAGGRVFSAASISFVGSLIGDANLQRIVKNVLAECGATT